MRRIILLLLFSPLALWAITIGTVVDGPSDQSDEILTLFQEEIEALLGNEFEIEFPEKYQLSGEWSVEGVENAISQLMGNPKVDIVIGVGVLTSYELACRESLPKPAIAPFVVGAVPQGCDQVSIVSFPTNIGRDLEVFRSITSFDHLAVVIDRQLYQALPEMTEQVQTAAKEMGCRVTPVLVGESTEMALLNFPPGIDAAYITPLIELPRDEFSSLMHQIHLRGIPTFSLLGRSEVEIGAMAGRAPEADLERIGRRVALNLQRILMGETPASLPSLMEGEEHMTLNLTATAMASVSPTWQTLINAEIIDDPCYKGASLLSLPTAIEEAMSLNLDLLAANLAVQAGFADVGIARSALLPQIGAQGLARAIDPSRAAASLGQEPQYVVSGTVALSQVIYSERAFANYAIQKFLQSARLEERETVLLDVVFSVAATYVNLLRAKDFTAIDRDNLSLTRQYLEFASNREEIGVSRSNEVYRWESELAINQAQVVHDQSQVRVLEVAVNRLLQRPPSCLFKTREFDGESLLMSVGHHELMAYLDTPRDFDIFRQFQIREGLETSPELKELDCKIAAQRRQLTATKRAFYTPDVGVKAEVTERFLREGRGKNPPSDLPIDLPHNNSTDWAVGVEATLPLSTGGERVAKKDKAVAELERLLFIRQATADRISERIYSSLENASASYLSIALSRSSAFAARKSLDLVSDAYSRGTVSMIDLLDAQNALLAAEKLVANASSDFAIDLLRVMRAVGRFDIFMSEEARMEWFYRLENFFRNYKEDPCICVPCYG